MQHAAPLDSTHLDEQGNHLLPYICKYLPDDPQFKEDEIHVLLAQIATRNMHLTNTTGLRPADLAT